MHPCQSETAALLKTCCVVVIPCLNEAETIGGLVRHVQRFIPRVVVVDDGSTDATGQEAAAAGASVLRKDLPEGKGRALDAGWNWAVRQGATWALCLDGDGQHCPDDIPAFFEEAARSGALLVVGNRMPEKHRMPWLRRQVNRWMSRRISRLTDQELPDSQCGFRLVSLLALQQVHIAADCFEIESDMLVRFAGAGFPISFVPIQVVYGKERSKIRPARDTVRWFRWWRKASRARRR